MKKVGDLMNEIGFRKDSSDEAKKAFIKNLIKQAYGSETLVVDFEKSKPVQEKEQLSFDFEQASEKTKVG